MLAGTWLVCSTPARWPRSGGSSWFATKSGQVRRMVLVHHRSYEHFTASSFADSDITQGDVTAGEDPVVRQAAIDALGNMYGTAVAIDPEQWPHSGNGQPEAGPLEWRRALFDD